MARIVFTLLFFWTMEIVSFGGSKFCYLPVPVGKTGSVTVVTCDTRLTEEPESDSASMAVRLSPLSPNPLQFSN